MSIRTNGPSGTRDFFPDDMRRRLWLFDKWRRASKSFGFEEYDGPILEYTDLYTRKGGDDIVKEMYNFTDREGTAVCLRPEMTPTVTRMMMSVYQSSVHPIKWFSIPQCWRFETTSKGRKREHYQWNCDIFGAERVKSEVEIFSILVSFFRSVGLTHNDIVIRISNRMILQRVLMKMGMDMDLFERACNIIDKLKKTTHDELSAMLKDEIGLDQESIDTLVELTKVKDIHDLTRFLDEDDGTLKEMLDIFKLAGAGGFADWLQFDTSIVRGLSYYTGLVFEVFSRSSGLQRSICGGGRYDKLTETYGYSEKVPAVGFGFGDIVMMELLKESNLLPECRSHVDWCVIAYSEDLYGAAMGISARLRDTGGSVILYPKCNRRLKQAYSYADRVGAERVVLVAPDEYRDNMVVVKYLRGDNRKEITIDIDDLFID